MGPGSRLSHVCSTCLSLTVECELRAHPSGCFGLLPERVPRSSLVPGERRVEQTQTLNLQPEPS